MEKTLFEKFVEKYFAPLVTKISERNEGGQGESYLFKEMLTPKYTPTLQWSSLNSDGRRVMADVVTMDSSLPLKRRPAIKAASGDVPKIGMKKYLGEREMTNLDILVNQNVNGNMNNAILQELFSDTRKCIEGVWEQNEKMFLQALSTGVTEIPDDENNNSAIRIDFELPDENKLSIENKWSGDSAKPITDIANALDEADKKGVTPNYVLMSKNLFNSFIKTDEVKELFASTAGIFGGNVPTPNLEQVNAALSSFHGVELIVVNRSVSYEKNGVRETIKPFDEENVVFLEDLNPGSLVWGTLAEELHLAKQVSYTKSDDYILLSKYHKVDPLREFTSSQALVVPVLDNVDSIFIMDTEDKD